MTTVLEAPPIVELLELQRVAEAASPSPWSTIGDGILVGRAPREYLLASEGVPGRFRRPEDAAYCGAVHPAVLQQLLLALYEARAALLDYAEDPAAQRMRDGRWLSSYGVYRASHALTRITLAGVSFPGRRHG
jgi:hypothetical protein